MELKPDDEVYDLGCGFGGMAHYLTPFAKRVTGFNISDHWLDYARDNYQGHYKHCAWEDIPEDKKVDKIYSDGMLVHTDHRLVYEKCARLLKPGGVMVHKELYPIGKWTKDVCRRVNKTFDNSGDYPVMKRGLKALEALGFESEVTEIPVSNYIKTIDHWFKNMDRKRQLMIELVGQEKLDRDRASFECFVEEIARKDLMTVGFIKSWLA